MAASPDITEFTIAPEEDGRTLAAVLHGRLGVPWSKARQLCAGGKVFLAEARWLDPAARVPAGARVTLRLAAPAPLAPHLEQARLAVVYEDSQIIVVDKPAGISSVPYERGEIGTAMDLVRDAWRVQGRPATQVPLHVVHRLDKDSSGLLLFAKTKATERALQTLWRQHEIERRYLCVAHGRVLDRRIESHLVPDRGDGLRGSLRRQDPERPQGKRAVTHVRAVEFLPLCTLCEVELETGKTHQIRIHLAEGGHPLVGERVYIRDFVRRDGAPLPSPRLLLHAARLGFVHPVSGEKILLERPPPADFQRQVERLRGLTTWTGTSGPAR